LRTRATDSVPTGPCSSGWIRRKDLNSTGELCQPALVNLLNLYPKIFTPGDFTVTHVRSLYPDKEYRGFQPSSPVFKNKRKKK
jgi:hypothetical protein